MIRLGYMVEPTTLSKLLTNRNTRSKTHDKKTRWQPLFPSPNPLTLLTLTKVSDSTEPTDYAAVSCNLGVASLLQGVASTLFG